MGGDCFFCRREWFDVDSLQNLWRFVKRHFLYVLLGRQDAHLSSLRQLEEERSVQEETLSWAGRLEEEHHERSRDWDLFLVRCTYGMGEYGKHMETYTVPYTCISYVYVCIYI